MDMYSNYIYYSNNNNIDCMVITETGEAGARNYRTEDITGQGKQECKLSMNETVAVT